MKAGGKEPIYMQVYGAIRGDIDSGRFRIGSRLPGTRSMAIALDVSRTVVLMAYQQLESEGYVASRGGSGTYVSARSVQTPEPVVAVDAASERAPGELVLSRLAMRVELPRQRARPPNADARVIDLALPRVNSDPRSLKHWRHTLADLLRRRSVPDFPVLAGVPQLRTALCRYLQAERGIVADPDDVLIIHGAQQARDLIARVLLDEGAIVGVEEPSHWGIRHTYAAAGARLVPCEVDQHGLDIARHTRALAGARLVSVAPSFQFPTGTVMPAARREALLRWAYAESACLVEDDFDCEHRYGVRTTPSLWSMDAHGRVIHISSFARSIYPALQLGYMLVPAGLREKFLAIKWLADRGSISLQQHVLATLMDSGHYLQDLRRVAQRLAPRHRALRDALKASLGDHVQVAGEVAGGTLFVSLPQLPRQATEALLSEALACGVRLRSAESFHQRLPAHVTLVLGYAGCPEANLKVAAARLADAYQRVTGSARAARLAPKTALAD